MECSCFGLQRKRQFRSIQFNGYIRVCERVCLCACVCLCIAAFFSLLLFRSDSFIHFSLTLSLAHCECESECAYVSVCVSFQRYTEMRMQSPYMLERTRTGGQAESKSKSERVREMLYATSIYSIYVYLSIYRFITHTPTHALHTLAYTNAVTDSEISERTSQNVCVPVPV